LNVKISVSKFIFNNNQSATCKESTRHRVNVDGLDSLLLFFCNRLRSTFCCDYIYAYKKHIVPHNYRISTRIIYKQGNSAQIYANNTPRRFEFSLKYFYARVESAKILFNVRDLNCIIMCINMEIFYKISII